MVDEVTFEEIRERIIAIDAEEVRLQEEKIALIRQLQQQCVHDTIIETPFKEMLLFATMPPP
ncbi:MAG: hypothetical protein Q7K44_03290 [Candidatus Liptonbacteria bacterium]|nr:hypothetical protein [Candidatus Liptonbacteria bacterium]